MTNYDRNTLIEENEKIMKDIIKYKAENSDNDSSLNDSINKNNIKNSLPDFYSKGFTNSKFNYRESYDLSKEKQFLSSKESYYGLKNPNKYSEPSTRDRFFYIYFRYDNLNNNWNENILINDPYSSINRMSVSLKFNFKYSRDRNIKLSNERLRQLEKIEGIIGTNIQKERENNIYYNNAHNQHKNLSKSEERKELMKRVEGHLGRIKYLYKERERDPYYVDYVLKKKKFLKNKSKDKNQTNQKSQSQNKVEQPNTKNVTKDSNLKPNDQTDKKGINFIN